MAEGSIDNSVKVLVIGGSAGSLEVLMQLFPLIDTTLNLAVIVVVHRKAGESMLTDLLNDKIDWPVVEAEEKDMVKTQTVYVAPADYHLLIEHDGTLSLDVSEKVHYSRPSIDVTFESAAEVWGERLIGLLLSGANSDGAQGLKTIGAAGGLTVVQNPEEATVGYMPQQALSLFNPNHIENTKGMAAVINRVATIS